MAFNQHKFDAFLKRVNKCNNIRLINFIRRVGDQYTLQCKKCKTAYFLYKYRQALHHKYGIQYRTCIKCLNQSQDVFKRMIHDMQKSTKTRNQRGRNHDPVFYDAQKLKDLFDKQNGLCFYSKENMKVKAENSFDPNLMSIERLDEDLGYVENNCVLICLKYQFTTRGVSAEVKKQIVQALKNPITHTSELNWIQKEAFKKTETTKHNRYKKRRTIEENGITLQQCTHCEEFKVLTEFYKNRDTTQMKCKTCTNKDLNEKRNSPYGFIMKMVAAAKASAKHRSLIIQRNDDSSDVDKKLFDIVVNKIIEQKGCCVRTGFIFVFKQNSPFQPSIDRLDNSKGYVKDNIQIVISPVNNSGRGTQGVIYKQS